MFSELYKIMVKKVTFAGFRGTIAPLPSSFGRVTKGAVREAFAVAQT